MLENKIFFIILFITCVFSASTSIVYSLIPYGADTYPTFATFDDVTGFLDFTIPSSGYSTTYSCAIYTYIASESNTVYNPVFINVVSGVPCNVNHCDECVMLESNHCQTCSTGYTLNSHDDSDCFQPSSSQGSSSSQTPSNSASPTSSNTSSLTKSSQTMALTSAGIGSGVALLMSSMNMSSASVICSIFSQFRLLIFLIMTDAYLPQSVIDYITGMKFFTFNFSFLSSQKFSAINKPIQYLDFDQSSSIMSSIGLNSGSSFVNNLNLLLTVFGMIAIHMIFRICTIWCCKNLSRIRNKCCRFILQKTINFFELAVYIRTFIESSQIVLISATSEISESYYLITSKIVSLCISIVTFILCLLVWMLILILWIKQSAIKIKNEEKGYFKELYEGSKKYRCSQGYTLYLISRANILIILMIFSSNIKDHTVGLENIKIYELVIVQSLYLILIVAARPLDQVESNLVLFINEFIFWVLSLMLIYYNIESRWTGSIENIYLRTISSNNIITAVILFIALLIKICIKCSRKCRSKKIKPKKVEIKVISVSENNQNSNITPITNEESKVMSRQIDSSVADFNYSYREENKSRCAPISVYLKNYKYRSQIEK